MQNKKQLKIRLMIIYITFFVVVLAAFAYNFAPDFARGSSQGSDIGEKIAKNWLSGHPRTTFLLTNVPTADVHWNYDLAMPTDSSRLVVSARIHSLDLCVEQEAPEDASVMSLAFKVLGGSSGIYALSLMTAAAYLAIIIFMFLIIHSLRRSIKEETVLDPRNIWMTRIIGVLIILTELFNAVMMWRMNQKAAELIANSNIVVDTTFPISYWNILLGLLVLFTAEVFAIGYSLSEEQKLTI